MVGHDTFAEGAFKQIVFSVGREFKPQTIKHLLYDWRASFDLDDVARQQRTAQTWGRDQNASAINCMDCEAIFP